MSEKTLGRRNFLKLSAIAAVSAALAACGATPTATPVPPTATKPPAPTAVPPTAALLRLRPPSRRPLPPRRRQHLPPPLPPPLRPPPRPWPTRKRPCWPSWSRPASCRRSTSACPRQPAGHQAGREGRQVRRHLAPRLQGRRPIAGARPSCRRSTSSSGSGKTRAVKTGAQHWPRSGNRMPTPASSPSTCARASSGPTARSSTPTTSSSGTRMST